MQKSTLTSAAEEDLISIWLYTYDKWGFDQAEKYYDQLISCCEVIDGGEAKSKRVEGLPSEIWVSRCQHHYIFFMQLTHPVILAILHGRMDFVERLKTRF